MEVPLPETEKTVRGTPAGGEQECTKMPDTLDSLPMITASLACPSLYLQHLGTEVPQGS